MEYFLTDAHRKDFLANTSPQIEIKYSLVEEKTNNEIDFLFFFALVNNGWPWQCMHLTRQMVMFYIKMRWTFLLFFLHSRTYYKCFARFFHHSKNRRKKYFLLHGTRPYYMARLFVVPKGPEIKFELFLWYLAQYTNRPWGFLSWSQIFHMSHMICAISWWQMAKNVAKFVFLRHFI